MRDAPMVDDMHGLASKNCVPCRGGIPPLPEARARELVANTPGWNLEEASTRVTRRFEFRDFVQAMRFVNRVAELAEQQGHHPDIAIHWNKVDLTLWTHKIGGLHENDFILAAKINRLLEDDPDATVAGYSRNARNRRHPRRHDESNPIEVCLRDPDSARRIGVYGLRRPGHAAKKDANADARSRPARKTSV